MSSLEELAIKTGRLEIEANVRYLRWYVEKKLINGKKAISKDVDPLKNTISGNTELIIKETLLYINWIIKDRQFKDENYKDILYKFNDYSLDRIVDNSSSITLKEKVCYLFITNQLKERFNL